MTKSTLMHDDTRDQRVASIVNREHRSEGFENHILWHGYQSGRMSNGRSLSQANDTAGVSAAGVARLCGLFVAALAEVVGACVDDDCAADD